MMDTIIQRFDERSEIWDDDPVRADLARRIVKMAKAEISAFAAPRLMDYGCADAAPGCAVSLWPTARHISSPWKFRPACCQKSG